ncbi:MAG: DNA-directed RNA polymerase subunit B'' [Candidatus Woesearchaeota archaeon]
MSKHWKNLLGSYFDKYSVVHSLIESYENFVENDMQAVVDEEKEQVPNILPPNVDDLKIVFKEVRMGKPVVFEADGSERELMPNSARLRKLTYSSPVEVDISTVVNGVPHESENVRIGSFPVMLRSKYCHLNDMDYDELVENLEDPKDPGGYFIVNGTERVIVSMENLAPNRFTVRKDGVRDKFKGTVFSEAKRYRIFHTVEKRNDGVYVASFSMIKKMPLIILIKALGITKDEEIMNLVDPEGEFDDVLVNLYSFSDIQTQEDALDYIGKEILPSRPKSARMERLNYIFDTYLLPHVEGEGKSNQLMKAYNLAKYWKKFIRMEKGVDDLDDRDHYMNKRLKAVGDSLKELFRYAFRSVVQDMLYNYQRLVKRGKTPSVSTLIRHSLFTSKVNSMMGTGNWIGNKTGVSQRIERLDHLNLLSHLKRISSPLASSRENFDARDVHPTHLGRLCPIETPEGPNIGLRKDLALMSKISADIDEDNYMDVLKKLGLKVTVPTESTEESQE